MDMASGLLSLKWNNHKSTFFHVLSSIRLKESYCDATIACDGNFYPVHKLILSTCSEYFEQIFDRTQCKHPVIVLKDIKSDDLEALMNYMYVGEVNVLQEKLGGLIKAAECLKIKGLAVPDEDVPSNEDKSNIEQTSPSPKRRRRDNLSNILPNKEFSSSKNLTDQDSSAVSGRLIGEDTSDLENQPPSQDSSSNLTKRKDVQPSGSQNTANESFVNVSDVKSEPPDIVEEILETKVAVVEDDSSYPDEPGDRISEAEGGGAFGSAQDPIADDDEDPLPSTSADYQGNSFATWEGDGSLSNFSNENFAAEENGDQRAMMDLSQSSSETEERDSDRALDRNVSTSSKVSTILKQRLSGSSSSELDFFSKKIRDFAENESFLSKRSALSHSIQKIFSNSLKSQQTTGYTSSSLPSQSDGFQGLQFRPRGSLDCSVCFKIFPTPTALKVHMRTHTGEKPFNCNYCDYRTAQKGNLLTHVRKHTGESPYICTICHCRFKSGSALTGHIRSKH